MNNVQQRAMRGMMWGAFGSLLQQGLSMGLGIFLARELLPGDYGLVGMLMVFCAIVGSLQEGGFISALANRREVRQEDYNAVFWCSLGVSVGCYAVLFLCAPLIVRFYGEPELLWLSRYLFTGFVFGALSIAPSAMLFKQMKVKQRTLVQVPALIVSGSASVAMAMAGYGCWALATQTVLYVAVCSACYWVMTDFRPTLHVDFRPVREMLGYSSRLLVTNVFLQLQENVTASLTGHFMGRNGAGQYAQSTKWNTMASYLIVNTVGSVAQPALTDARQKENAELEVLRAMLRATAWLAFPALLGLALVARPFIVLFITDRWLPCVPLLQILCVWGAVKPVNHLLVQAVLSRGRSVLYMWLTVSAAMLQIVGLLLCRHLGLQAMACSFVVVNLMAFCVWVLVVRRLTSLRLRMFVADTLPFLLAAVVALAVAWWLTRDISALWPVFALRVLITCLLYLSFTFRQLQKWGRKM